MIVQYVEPDFLDSLDAFSKPKANKIKVYLQAVVAHIEQSETIEDLKKINFSNIEFSDIPSLHILAGRSTGLQFPKQDIYVYRFDEFGLFFCLRSQVCTFLRVEGIGQKGVDT